MSSPGTGSRRDDNQGVPTPDAPHLASVQGRVAPGAATAPGPDPVVKLAYDEARAALREQDDTLGKVRNRAAGLLAAAAVGTSFAATAGLLNTDPKRGAVFPAWGAWLLLAVVVVIAFGMIVVLWPTSQWDYGPAPQKLLEHAGQDFDGVLVAAAGAMIHSLARNGIVLDRRVLAYRFTAGALVAEVVLLTVILIVARG